MYKVFFNGHKIELGDKVPEKALKSHHLVIQPESISDLQIPLMGWLENDPEEDLYICHPDSDYLTKTFTSCFTLIPAAGGLVKNSQAEDLVIFRRGVWDLPKGKAETGETPEQTALREVREECHLKKLKIIRPLIITYHIYFLDETPILKETRWFEMKYDGKKEPKPQKKEEITMTIWLPFSKLDTIAGNTFPNVLDVIRAGQL